MTETPDIHSAADPIARLRIIDASVNRASEGLRVVEDYTRFALDDRHLTRLCKQLRHELNQAIEQIPAAHRYSARDTQADVGTSLGSPSDQQRVTARDVAEASLRRLAEALRSIEEYSKCFYPVVSTIVESLRYRLYTIGRAITGTTRAVDTLVDRLLYVLVDATGPIEPWQTRLERLLTAGVDVIQLRDKRVTDRELLLRARALRSLTRAHQTLFIINDRPDIARLAQADGVHVGQDELTVKDARSMVGPELLIGVSTHNIEQARQAVLDGADYLGCGPVFPSSTKTFTEFPGLEFLRQVQAEIRLPAFAIGGIDSQRIVQVRSTGFTRVAVSSAVWHADSLEVSIAQLRAELQPRG